MKKLLLLSVLTLSACGTPAIVLIPAVVGTGLAINAENYNKAHPENPIDTASEVKHHLVKGVKAGYSQ